MTSAPLRSAVAAAIASKPAPPRLSRAAWPRQPGPLDIAILTMNGFQIRRASDASLPSSSEHACRVRQVADGVSSTVFVAIDREAVERVARLTHRRLEAGGTFWRRQAERLLSASVWSEGKAPDGRLTVLDVSREALDVAARWEEE